MMNYLNQPAASFACAGMLAGSNVGPGLEARSTALEEIEKRLAMTLAQIDTLNNELRYFRSRVHGEPGGDPKSPGGANGPTEVRPLLSRLDSILTILGHGVDEALAHAQALRTIG